MIAQEALAGLSERKAPSQRGPQRQCLTYVLTMQEGLAGYGEEGSFQGSFLTLNSGSA